MLLRLVFKTLQNYYETKESLSWSSRTFVEETKHTVNSIAFVWVNIHASSLCVKYYRDKNRR